MKTIEELKKYLDTKNIHLELFILDVNEKIIKIRKEKDSIKVLTSKMMTEKDLVYSILNLLNR